MQTYWIWFDSRKHISASQKLALLERFSDPERIYHARKREFLEQGLSPEGLEALLDRDLTPARRIADQCADMDIGILTLCDERYPERLKNIPDPPLVLYYRGRLPEFDKYPAIGVVGTRKASSYGMSTAAQMGWQISRCGGIVVSGMASGIDGAATKAALSSGRPAVGVLGCGVDRIFPKENRQLYADMLEGGCLISEFTPGTPAYKWNFPRRNRIISGLCLGVLVVEAPVQSGAMITARQALEQGRDVFVVPGNINVASCEGSNSLLRDGAIMAGSGWDVVSEYAAQYPDTVRRDMMPMYRERRPLQVAQNVKDPAVDKKGVDKDEEPTYSVRETTAPSLTAVEQAVLDKLPVGEGNLDDIIAETCLSAGEVLAALTTLRIKGYVSAITGRRVLRTQ